jgi:hypothetical protein
MAFLLYFVYPLSFCDKKKKYFLLFLGQEFISKPIKCFLSQNSQRESLLVFYVGYILDDKNTLCNGCILNRFIGFIQSLQAIWIVFVSSHVIDHKFLEDVHEDSMHFPSQINRFLCNRPGRPLKASGRPLVSRSFSIEDVLTLDQHRPDARSSFSNFYTELNLSRHYFGSFCKTSRQRGNTSGRYPAFQNISGFPYRRGK